MKSHRLFCLAAARRSAAKGSDQLKGTLSMLASSSSKRCGDVRTLLCEARFCWTNPFPLWLRGRADGHARQQTHQRELRSIVFDDDQV